MKTFIAYTTEEELRGHWSKLIPSGPHMILWLKGSESHPLKCRVIITPLKTKSKTKK